MNNLREDNLEKELKILAEKNRLGILSFLKKKKSAPVGQIADNLSISFKATSKHLLILVKSGILKSQRDGIFIIYYISSDLSPVAREVISLL